MTEQEHPDSGAFSGEDGHEGRGSRRFGRRVFVGLVAVVAVGVVAGAAATGLVGKVAGGVKRAMTPTPVYTGFHIYAPAGIPVFDPAAWTLTVDGLVDKPLSLTHAELRQLPFVSEVKNFHCVTGWSVKNVEWGGIRVSTLLDMARPKADAKFVTFYSMDGVFSDSLSIADLARPEVLLAYDMYRKPLTAPHGSPLRLIVPSMYGYKAPKWINRMELKETEDLGYWEIRGHPVDATVN